MLFKFDWHLSRLKFTITYCDCNNIIGWKCLRENSISLVLIFFLFEYQYSFESMKISCMIVSDLFTTDYQWQVYVYHEVIVNFFVILARAPRLVNPVSALNVTGEAQLCIYDSLDLEWYSRCKLCVMNVKVKVRDVFNLRVVRSLHS